MFKIILSGFFIFFYIFSEAQITSPNDLKPNAEKEKKFLPYVAILHGGIEKLEAWKQENTYQYFKELWYYTESFYISRNYLKEGLVLNEEIIDISRFEFNRKQSEESIVIIPGFKDVLILYPSNKLFYKP
jgi:hypothetical protein